MSTTRPNFYWAGGHKVFIPDSPEQDETILIDVPTLGEIIAAEKARRIHSENEPQYRYSY